MSDVPKPFDHDEMANNVLAAGALWMALGTAGLDPEVITEDDGVTVTNRLSIGLRFLKSRYMVTVERIPETELVEDEA